jgi:hypothetical protein
MLWRWLLVPLSSLLPTMFTGPVGAEQQLKGYGVELVAAVSCDNPFTWRTGSTSR